MTGEKEVQDVTTIDLPEAFLHALNDDDVITLSRGHLVELMMIVVPQFYYQYIITNSKGKSYV